MLYSTTCEYAIRALVSLADSRGGGPVLRSDIAESAMLPTAGISMARSAVDATDSEARDGQARVAVVTAGGIHLASDEPFDMHELSGAHRTLPLPSWVRVTNLANGRQVVLRVNDRGPFADPDRRIIDVSYAAAIRLGMVGTGTAPVRVQAIEPWQYRR